VGLKPANLSFAQAGVVPLVGLTNLESFYAAGAPWYNRSNLTVVVTSGQGGTGHVAVPMAKALGATTVVSSASTANIDWVKSLGADVVVDYTKESIWSVLPDDSVDVV
jgi:NADPH:quinone reductase-like Zn-dependent oxidoreductase